MVSNSESAVQEVTGLSTICGLLFCLFGCGPSNYYWAEGMDGFVGKRVDSGLGRCLDGCTGSFWSPTNHNRQFSDIVSEGGGKRYYVDWNSRCAYSMYVSKEGVIESWRYEGDSKGCYVY